jgi:hypothetical protein
LIEDEDDDDQIMDGLYPIIRRVRRPLINTGRLVVPVVVPAPQIEQEGTEGREVLPHGQNTSEVPRTTTSTRTSTIKNPEERHARKTKET